MAKKEKAVEPEIVDDDCLNKLRAICKTLNTSQWDLGDWYNLYEDGEKKKACLKCEINYDTALRAGRTASAYPIRQRKYNLSFRHYYETLRITVTTHGDARKRNQARRRLLEQAEKNKKPSSFIRNKVDTMLGIDNTLTLSEDAIKKGQALAKALSNFEKKIVTFRDKGYFKQLSKEKQITLINSIISVANDLVFSASLIRDEAGINNDELLKPLQIEE